MAIYTYNSYTDWKQIPIDMLKITTGTDTYQFQNLDSSSSYSLRPILRTNDSGGSSVVGFRFDGKFDLIQNNYEDMQSTLAALVNQEITEVAIRLKAITGQPNGEQLFIQPAGNATVSVNHVNWEINQDGDDESPVLTINTSFIVSKDAIDDVLSKMIIQSW